MIHVFVLTGDKINTICHTVGSLFSNYITFMGGAAVEKEWEEKLPVTELSPPQTGHGIFQVLSEIKDVLNSPLPL